MVVILDDGLFGPVNAGDFELLGFLYALSQGRHLGFVDDTPGSPFDVWLLQQARNIQIGLKTLLASFRAQLAQPLRRTSVLRIVAGIDDDWSGTPVTLSLSSAQRFLGKPFHVFVENNRADKHFMFAFMTAEERAEFVSALNNGWAVIVHGGGLGELERQIQEFSAASRRPDMSGFVLFDSDSLRPMTPGGASAQLQATCQRLSIPHHQLRRRAIENYLPVGALNYWCYQVRKRGGIDRTLRAYLRMTSDQRYHFNMKSGLRGDQARIGESRGLFDNLDFVQLRHLQKGFGSRVALCFEQPNLLPEYELQQELAWDEVRPVVRTMLLMM